MVTMVLIQVRKRIKTGDPSQLLLLVFCLLGLYTLAQQKPIVGLSSDKQDVGVDESIVFRVSTNVEGSISIEFPSEFEVDYGVMHQISQEMDQTGRLKTFYITQNSGSFKKAGTYSFYATVKYKSKAYKSNKITITVDEDKEQDLAIRSNDPVFGYIEAKKMTVYEGECVMLNAKVISRYPILNVVGYQPYKCDKNAEEHPFNYAREFVEETKLNGKKVQTFEYGKQLIFPVATGKCRIKPFEMALRCHGNIFDRTFTFKSTGLTLNVKPLPKGAPSDFIGGVGVFSMEHQLSDISKLKPGDVFQMKIVVSGTGNLHNIQAPKLNLPPGCKIYGDPQREENYDFTESGVTGDITFTYTIQVLQEGELHFEAPSISYFDPRKEKYITLSTEPFAILLGKEKGTLVQANPESGKTVKGTEVSSSTKSSTITTDNGSNLPIYLGIGIPGVTCALFLLFLLARKKRSREEHLQAMLVEEREQKAIAQATTDYWAEIEQRSDDANHISITLPKAIIQHLEKKYGLQNTSRERVLSELGNHSKEDEKEIREIISVCDHFRYGFGVQDFPSAHLIERVRLLLRL